MPIPGTVHPRAESRRDSPRRWRRLKATRSSAPRCSTRDAAQFVGVPPTAMQYESRSAKWRTICCANGSRRFDLIDRRRSWLAAGRVRRIFRLPRASTRAKRRRRAGLRLHCADTHRRTFHLAGLHPCRQCRWRNAYDAQRRVVQPGQQLSQLDSICRSDKAGDLREQVTGRYPQLFKWIDEYRRDIASSGFASPAGRRRYWDGLNSADIDKRNRAQRSAVRWLIGMWRGDSTQEDEISP